MSLGDKEYVSKLSPLSHPLANQTIIGPPSDLCRAQTTPKLSANDTIRWTLRLGRQDAGGFLGDWLPDNSMAACFSPELRSFSLGTRTVHTYLL